MHRRKTKLLKMHEAMHPTSGANILNLPKKDKGKELTNVEQPR